MNKFFILSSVLFILLAASCNTAKLSTAEAQYDRGEYFQAANTFRKVYNKTSSSKERTLKGQIAYKAATCYDRLNMAARASSSYQNAIRYNFKDSLVFLNLAQNLHKEGKYKDALKNYLIYSEYNPDNQVCKNGIRGANTAIEEKNKNSRYIVRRSDIFNNRRADFSPVIFNKDADYIYITTANDKVTGTDKSDITGLKPSDIWVSKKDEKGIWQKPEPVTGDINTEFDEGTPAFTPDGNTMYFTRARRDAVAPTTTEIFKATRSDAQWSGAKKVEITRDTLSVFAHPAVSPDGKYLYFVSDMPGGYGGKDIWRMDISPNGNGVIDNLGDQINTAGDEVFPTFRHDGTLYFSSNGHPGMGGLDIFKAREDEWGIWHVDRMPAPINSFADDFGITFFQKEEEEGLFASNRNDGRGYDHIFTFVRPSLKILISGIVTDNDEEPIPNAIVRVVGKDGSNHKIVSKNDGTFDVKIDRGTQYVMMAGAPGFLNKKEEFRSDYEEEDATYEVNFILASINKPVLIDNIFYDFDKATLREESTTALNELVTLLEDNPNVAIELAAHTDRVGSEEYNMNLSQRRAQSVVDYLIKSGIEPQRLNPRGYGMSSPKIADKRLNQKYPFIPEDQVLDAAFIETLTDEEKEIVDQINRRTEFSVTDTTYGIY